VKTALNVRVIPVAESTAPFVRFEMMTTEPARKEDPNKPDSALKPQVSLEDFQFGSVSQELFPLSMRVPLDTPSSSIDAVVSAEFVSQPLAPSIGSKSWTAPVTLFVDDAVTLTASAEPIKAAKLATVAVNGTLQRHPLFTEPVTLTMDGLPAGITAAPVVLAPDQSDFSFTVMTAEAAVAGEVPNLSIKAQQSSGNVISKSVPVKLVVE
jgi:hypothetical protein